MRNRLDRDAKKWQPIQYWLGILGVILIEGLINFESFTTIPWATPFLASGMTLAVALFIGYAAHRHGIFICQFKELMGGEVGRKDKLTTVVKDSVALLLLLVALGIVAMGRYYLLRDAILLGDITGEGNALSAWLQLGGAMLSNVGVYLFGVLWSTWRHDPVPGYMEKRIEKEKAENKYHQILARDVTQRVRMRTQEAEKEANAKRKAASALRGLPEYQQQMARFFLFHKKDSEVAALLGEYRRELVRNTRQTGAQPFFAISGGFYGVDNVLLAATGVETRRLTPDEYLGVSLSLKHIT